MHMLIKVVKVVKICNNSYYTIFVYQLLVFFPP